MIAVIPLNCVGKWPVWDSQSNITLRRPSCPSSFGGTTRPTGNDGMLLIQF
jgi:hypothetical protein